MADLKELLDKQAELQAKKSDAKKEKENEITKVLTFFIGEQIYGIEIPYVIEIIGVPTITRVPGIPSYIKGIINVRSKVVPVVNIRSRFGKEEIEMDDRTSIIIVAFNDVQVGLIVDEVLDVLSVSQKHIASTPELSGVNANKYINYILEMNDGIKLVLDIQKLIYDGDMNAQTAE